MKQPQPSPVPAGPSLSCPAAKDIEPKDDIEHGWPWPKKEKHNSKLHGNEQLACSMHRGTGECLTRRISGTS